MGQPTLSRRWPEPLLPALIAGVLMLLVQIASLVTAEGKLLDDELPNPDSYYKLVTLRSQTPEHGFRFVARDNAPHGSWIHWSAPHAYTVWSLYRGLRATGLPEPTALRYAGGAVTVTATVMLSILLAVAATGLGGRTLGILSGLMMATSVPVLSYGRFDQITHHIFMLLPLAAAAACLLRPGNRIRATSVRSPDEVQRNPGTSRHGGRPFPDSTAFHPGYTRNQRLRNAMTDAAGGALLGLALWISPETMAFVVGLAYVRMALRLQNRQTPPLWPAAAGLLAMTGLARWLDSPPPGFGPWALDHISLAYLLLAGLLGLCLCLADACARSAWPLRRSLPVLIAASLAACALWLLAVPDALNGPQGLVAPELQTLFWDYVRELRPVSSASQAVAYLMLPLCAAALGAWAAWRERSLWLAALAFMALAYGVLCSQHLRMGAAAAVASTLTLCAAAATLRAFAAPRSATRAQQYAGLAITLLPPVQLGLFIACLVIWPTPKPDAPCSLRSAAPALQALAPSTILIDLFKGPELLFRTPHRVIAGPYHHNTQGMLDDFHALLDPDGGEAAAIIRRRAVDYVLGCRQLRSQLRGAEGQRTLAERLADGDVPAWLSPVPWPEGIDTDWRLYRVQAQALPQ